jgi:hypothetical protein
VNETQPDPIRTIHEELAGYLAEMRTWSADCVFDALQSLASMNARAAEIRHRMHGSNSPRARSFREGELRDFFDTCEFQFKVYSRLQAVRQSEFDLARGY